MRDVTGESYENPSMVIGKYFTKLGKPGIVVTVTNFNGKRVYSWTGKWAAGSSTEFSAAELAVACQLKYHPRYDVRMTLCNPLEVV